MSDTKHLLIFFLFYPPGVQEGSGPDEPGSDQEVDGTQPV